MEESEIGAFASGVATFERELVTRALAGDHRSGEEALRLCASGLTARNLSPELSNYLAERLSAYLSGEPLARALCVEQERSAGKPADPLPAWRTCLAAFDLLLERRNYRVEKRNAAMDRARAMTNEAGRGIHRSDASKVRKEHLAMKSLDDDLLYHFAGEKLRAILREYNPQ